jgi:hypothetical protein
VNGFCKDTVTYVKSTNGLWKGQNINAHKIARICLNKYRKRYKIGTIQIAKRVKYDLEQMFRGVNVLNTQLQHNTSTHEPISENVQNIKVITLHNAQEYECTESVQMYGTLTVRTVETRECDCIRERPAKNNMCEAVYYEMANIVKGKQLYPIVQNIAERCKMSVPMDQDPTSSEIRSGLSGTYIRINPCKYKRVIIKARVLYRSTNKYKAKIRCSNWYKEYGE